MDKKEIAFKDGESIAFFEGWKAWHDGLRKSSNPYHPESNHSYNWYSGWEQAEEINATRRVA